MNLDIMKESFLDELEKVAAAESYAPPVSERLLALLAGGAGGHVLGGLPFTGAIGSSAGLHKGGPDHGAEGALRGGLGAVAGQHVGQAATKLLSGHSRAARIAGSVMPLAGAIGGYKLLTHNPEGWHNPPAKTAGELTPSVREHIKPKNFALSPKQSDTGKPAYPIEDKRHASNALARVKQFGSPAEKSEVYKDVAKKFPGLAAKSSVPAVKKQAGVLGSIRQGLTHGVGEHATELAGLGILAVPGMDTIQAKLRSRGNPGDWEKKRLLGEGAHAAADVGGLGILAAPEALKLMRHRA